MSNPQSSYNQDIYQAVTDQVITLLNQGVRPWEKGWFGGNLPIRHNGEHYRGINILILGMAADKHGYSNPHWHR